MKWFITAILLVTLSACASVSVDPKSGVISYFRMGDQQIEGLEFRMDKDGKIIVKISKQGASGDALVEALKIINVLTVK